MSPTGNLSGQNVGQSERVRRRLEANRASALATGTTKKKKNDPRTGSYGSGREKARARWRPQRRRNQETSITKGSLTFPKWNVERKYRRWTPAARGEKTPLIVFSQMLEERAPKRPTRRRSMGTRRRANRRRRLCLGCWLPVGGSPTRCMCYGSEECLGHTANTLYKR